MGALLMLLFASNANSQCLTAPFTETFDTGTQPSCVLTSTTSGSGWDFTPTFWNTACGTPGNHTTGSGTTSGFVGVDQSGTDAGTILEFDTIDVSATPNPYLSFYYFMCNTGYTPINILAIETWDGTAWVGVDTLQEGFATWTEYNYDLSGKTFGTNLLKFRLRAESGGSGGDFNGDHGIDDVSIIQAPSCFKPTALSTTVTPTGVDFNWTENNSATTWELEYGTTGFSAGTGTSVIATSNPTTLTTLVSGTTYDWYIRSICGSADSSLWVKGNTFVFAGAPLAGAYTVDAASPTSGTNFQNFADLALKLNSAGVSAAVTVNVATGTYTEQVSIGAIAGASNTNTVTIDGGTAAAATLTHDKFVRNSTLNLDGTSYLTISNMTIAATGGSDSWGIHVWNGAHHITIDNNIVTTPIGTTSDVAGIMISNSETSDNSTADVNDLTISNNTVTGGERGISVYGNYTASSRSQNLTIHNNDIQNADDNGLYITGYNNITITDNSVDGLNSSFSDGMYSSDLENFTITGNSFKGGDNGLEGNDYNYDNTVTARSIIANNMFIGGDDGLYLDDVEEVDVYHNSASGEDYGFYVNDDANLDIRNNIFNSNGGDIAFYCLDASTTMTLDYNIYYTNGATLAKYGTPTYADLAAFQAGQATLNVNSLSGDPLFNNPAADLHSAGSLPNDAGDNTVGILVDIDGDVRPLAPSTTVDIGADEFAPSACILPGGLAISNLAATSATATWVENGTATQWELEYGLNGFTLGSGTSMVIITNTFVSITGLTFEMTYDFYVRAICGSNDTSSWAGPNSFFTGYCTPAPSSVDGSGITNVSYDTVNNTTGVEQGNYGNYSSIVGNIAQSTTAAVNITFSTGYTYETQIWIDWNDDLDFSDAGETVYTATAPATNPTTLNATFLVPAAATLGQHRMRIGGGDNPVTECYTGSYASFEDYTVNVTAPPACLAPTALVSSNVATTTALASWTENGTATTWEVSYGAAGTSAGSGTTFITTTNPDSISGLIPATAYVFYVRSICAPTDTSTWSSGSTFTTAIQGAIGVNCTTGNPTIILSEEFDNNNAGWTNIGTGGTNWEIPNNATSSNTGANVAHSGASYMNYEASGGNAGGATVSPSIDLTTAMNDVELSFWLHAYGANMGDLNVGIGTSAAGPFTTVFTQVGQLQTAGSDPWTNVGVNLASYIGQTIYLQFDMSNVTGFTSDMSIDLVEVSTCASCSAPSGLISSNGFTTADIVWTENGTATSWEVEWDSSGYTSGTSLNSSIVNVDTFTTITGLMANTNYDYNVRAICAVGDTSGWVGSSFYTGYCTPAPSSVDGSGITNVSYDTVNNTTGVEQGNYGNYSSIVGNIAQSTTAAVNITLSTGYTYDMQIWIDWNDDLDFTDAGETVYTATAPGINPTTLNATFVVPTAAPLGQHRMRIGGGDNPVTECYTGSWASFEDYTVNVTAPPACIAPTALNSNVISANSVGISWTDGNATAAPSYQISYGAPGFTAGMGTQSVVTSDTATLSSLMAATGYDWYVRSLCSLNDTSSWSSAGNFVTGCPVSYPAPFSEGFSSPTIPTCWSQGAGNLENWLFTHNGGHIGNAGNMGSGTTTSGATSTSGMAVVDDSSPSNTNTALETPFIDVSTLTIPRLTFFTISDNEGNLNGNVDFHVDVYDGATWNDSLFFSNTNSLNGTWEQIIVDLSQLTITGPIQIRFVVDENNGTLFDDDRAIDDVVVEETPNCLAPTALSASGIGVDSAAFAWTSNNVPPSASYQVSYGPVGFTPGTGTQYVTSNNPDTVGGLIPATDYNVYVREICSSTDTSSWTTAAAFSTGCPPAIMAPYTQSFDGTSLPSCWAQSATSGGPWVFGGPGFNWNQSGCTGIPVDHTGNGGSYAALDFSVPDAGVILELPNVDVTAMTAPYLEFYFTMCSNLNPVNILVIEAYDGANWDTVTVVQQGTNGWERFGFLIGAYTYSTNLVKLRFRAEDGGGTQFYGDMGIDDVTVGDAPANDIAITDIITPASGCGLTSTEIVQVEIKNFGSAAQTGFPLVYTLDGVAVTPETFTGSLASGASMTYSFTATADLSTVKAYDITAYTQLTADVDTTNDSSAVVVISSANVTTFPYAESFEAGNGGWILTGSSSWALGAPAATIIDTASDGTQAWVTNLAGNYGDNEVGFITSPCLDFTNVVSPYIALDIFYDIETSWDGATMQSSVDAGLTWQLVGALGDPNNWYNDGTINALASTEPSEDGWSGNGAAGSGSWVTAENWLSGLGGLSGVTLRIVFASDGNTNNEGMAFDNVTISDVPVPVPDPYYPIATINTEDATTGIADSANVDCFTSGIVTGIDIDGNTGISFTIIDMSSGSQEGIVIFNFVDVSNYVVTEGDSIMVHGYVDQYNGLTQIRVDSILTISTGVALPAPIVVTDLDETTESKYLSIPTSWVSLSTSGAFSSNVDLTNGTDTITMRIDSDTDINDSLTSSGLPIVPGDTICGLLGVGGQFDGSSPYTDGYQIFPMRWTDLTICRLSTGIESSDLASAQFELVPNPTNGLFEIKSSGFNNSTINVYVRDINGRLISSEFVSNANGNFSKSFDLNEESKGVYFITIVDGVSVINEKLIVQ